MLKSKDNPPILWPLDQSFSDSSTNWWVAHTKSRFEKSFAWDLKRLDIPYFLPMVQRVTIAAGKKRTSLMPLFPGYVFFSGGEMQRYTALTTGRICATIKATDQGQLLTELDYISRALASDLTIDSYAFAAVGKRVRITKGALRGIEGIVLDNHNPTRMVMQVSMLGQGASLEISADLLEAA